MFNIEGVSWGQLVDYYRRDSYYFGPATESAWVHGSGTHQYGYDRLAVDPLRVFERMVSGRKAPALDLCLSAPKSVSLMAVLGNDVQRQDAIDAHLAAVRMTLDYIEEAGFFRVQRKQRGNNFKYRAEGFMVVAVDHLLSREMEPQLHTHALAANIGILPGENRVRAADFKLVYDWQKHLDRVYKGHLQMALRQKGHSFRLGDHGFELAQVSDAQIEAFSTAKMNIDTALVRQGNSRAESTARERQRLNKKIRKKKQEVADEEELRRHWQEKARAVDLCLEMAVSGSLIHLSPDETWYLVERFVDEYLGMEVTATRVQIFDYVLEEFGQSNAIVDPEMLLRAMEEVLSANDIFALPGQQVPAKDFLQEEMIAAAAIRREMDRLRNPAGENLPCNGRDNPLDLLIDGLDREVDGSTFLCAVATAVANWQKRSQAVKEARAELKSLYGDDRKIPKALQCQLSELQQDVAAGFREELKAARKLQPGTDRLTAAETLVVTGLERWERKNNELQTKYRADKSRFRTANHQKRLNSNDAWLANRVAQAEKMPWAPEKAIADLLEELARIMRHREAAAEVVANFPAGLATLTVEEADRTECGMEDETVDETELWQPGGR